MSKRKSTQQDRYVGLHEGIKKHTPQVYKYLTDEEEFRGLLFKVKPDGSVLAVAKAYGSDGGELVCFAGGYGVIGALLALEGTLAANAWRVDEPWPGKGK